MPTNRPKQKLKAFVASSSESRDIAQAIFRNLDLKDVEVTPWWGGNFFEPMGTAFDALVRKVKEFDFGVFIFGPDDVTQIREISAKSVRDNVLFELGLFIGALGPRRAFIVAHPNFQGMHLPTDLAGLTLIHFRYRDDGDLALAAESPCGDLLDVMNKLGPWSERLEKARDRVESGGGELLDLTSPDNIIAEKQIGGGSFVVINDDI